MFSVTFQEGEDCFALKVTWFSIQMFLSNSCILSNNSNTFTFRAIFYCSSETISKTVDLAGERCAVENMFCINLVSFVELKC